VRIYPIGSRFGRLAVAAVFAIVGIGFIGVALVSATQSDSSIGPAIVSGIVGLAALVVATLMLRPVVEIRLAEDGTVELIRPIGKTMLSVWQIWVLEGTIGSDYGRTIWSLRVQHTRGAMHFGEFRTVKHFAHRVKTLNPSVEISGVWPMGPP
jgi:hypothetical protein